jgi:hypothetical protein
MTLRARVAWALAAVTWVSAVAQVAVAILADGIALFSVATFREGFPILTLAAVIGATVGALIVSRQPDNRIGWLLCIGQVGTIVGLVVADYGRDAFDGRIPGSRGAAQQAMWVGHVLGGRSPSASSRSSSCSCRTVGCRPADGVRRSQPRFSASRAGSSWSSSRRCRC